MTYTVENLPAGAQLDAASGRVSWTPRFSQAGTYTLKVKADDGLTATAGDVTVTVSEAGDEPTTPTPPGAPAPTPSPAPAPVGPPPHRTPAPAAHAPDLQRTQRSTVVHGEIKISRAHSRLQVELLAAKHALGHRGHGHLRVGRLVKTASDHAEFALALSAAARRALRRHGKLALEVRITVTPATGTRYTTTRRVTLLSRR